MITLYHYKKCSTCRKAIRFLEEHNIAVEQIDYTEHPLTKEQLTDIYKKSTLPLKRLFNTSGIIYREMGLKDNLVSMTEDEQLTLLSEHAMLVKRPIIVADTTVLIGFKESEWLEKLVK